jgi:hypothetical protein
MSHRIGHRIFLLLATNCVQIFVRFRSWITARPRLVRFAAPAIVFAVVLAPSIWMLSVIPPLWKDIDAYAQVTLPPGSGTILQYGPLYCFLARIPLYVGYAIDCVARGAPLPAPAFFIHPTLTDSGVFALLLSQHILLCFGTSYLIGLTTRLFWVRLILALAWALNPLFYTFAHCIGTETLSMILVLLLGATGFRIVRYSRKVPGREWLLFGVLLWLSILTRHINATLAGVLPLAFFFLSTFRLILIRFSRSQLLHRWQRLRTRQALQKAAVAVAIGIGCIVLTNVSLRGLCYAVNTSYRSTAGPAFLGRLKFLARLPVEKRNLLLDKTSENTNSPDVKKLISLLRDSFRDENPNWDAIAFKENAQAFLFSPQTSTSEKQFYDVLNRTTWAFLYPPDKIFLSAITTDLQASQRITIPDVVSFLFVTTRFYFSHATKMPQCASLVTFRDRNAAQVFAIFKNHSYFRHPKHLSYRALLFLWVIILGLFAVIARMRKQEAAGVVSYAAALTIIGLFVMLANCVLAVFQPRYTLPMWELTIVSLSILFGGIMDALFPPSYRRRSPKLDDQPKHSDHV